jgi:hypothetical protein
MMTVLRIINDATIVLRLLTRVMQFRVPIFRAFQRVGFHPGRAQFRVG